MSTRRRVWLYVTIFAVAVAIYYPFSAGGSQSLNMRRAERYIKALAPQVNADPRFAEVRLDSYTAHGGSLGVFGAVATDGDAEALRSLIRNSNPPVEVAFRFRVVSPATRPQE